MLAFAVHSVHINKHFWDITNGQQNKKSTVRWYSPPGIAEQNGQSSSFAVLFGLQEMGVSAIVMVCNIPLRTSFKPYRV